jgi:hypothetical protein
MHANGGGEARDRKNRERDAPMGGEGADAGEDEAPARKVNDLQSSTDAVGGSAPMEGVESLFRCNRAPRLPPTNQLPL